jgi:hypothetical protein
VIAAAAAAATARVDLRPPRRRCASSPGKESKEEGSYEILFTPIERGGFAKSGSRRDKTDCYREGASSLTLLKYVVGGFTCLIVDGSSGRGIGTEGAKEETSLAALRPRSTPWIQIVGVVLHCTVAVAASCPGRSGQ